LITFASSARVLVPHSPLTAVTRRQALAELEGLRAAGKTHYAEGLRAVQHQLQRAPKVTMSWTPQGSQKRAYVVWISDGEPTVGPIRGEELAARVLDLRQQGALLETIGVGTYFKTDLMRCLAEVGGGRSLVLVDSQQLVPLLPKMLQSVRQPLVEELQWSLELADGIRVVRSSGNWRALDSGRLQGRAALLRDEEILHGVVEVELPANLLVSDELQLGEMQLSYRHLNNSSQQSEHLPIWVRVQPEGTTLPNSSIDDFVLGEWVGLTLREALELAYEQASAGDSGAAQETLRQHLRLLEKRSPPATATPAARTRVEIVREFARTLADSGFTAALRDRLFHDLHCPHHFACACRSGSGPRCPCLAGRADSLAQAATVDSGR
jgi:uncharacterized protein YegL